MKELEIAVQALRKTGNPVDATRAMIIDQMIKGRRKDVSLSGSAVATQPEPKINRRRGSELSLGIALADYESNPHTPELITATFQAIWTEREAKVADLLEKPLAPVLPCDRIAEEIKQLEAEGRRLAYLPPEFATQEKRYILGAMFPEMRSHSMQEENTVVNEEVRSGWFDYEVSIDAPYLNTTEDKLRKQIENEGRLEINATEYLVAGQDSKLLTGKYLDQDSTRVRLLGSRNDGGVVYAFFLPDGRLSVHSSLRPRNHDGSLGGRSVGVK